MSDRGYLILHGWQNDRPPEHWQYWLAAHLRERGELVLYPQLPSPQEPSLEEWITLLRAELAMLGDRERVVICHSLACLLWLRHAATDESLDPVERLLLVCPPSPSSLPHELGPFFPAADDREALARSVHGRPQLVCTDADPWCREGAAELYGERLGADVQVVPGGGHLAVEDGYGPWPAVARWALRGSFGPAPVAALV